MVAEIFRTFDLSELPGRELHAYDLGISFAIIRLNELRKKANGDFDAASESDDRDRLIEVMGSIGSLAALAHILDREHFVILMEIAKRREENKDG